MYTHISGTWEHTRMTSYTKYTGTTTKNREYLLLHLSSAKVVSLFLLAVITYAIYIHMYVCMYTHLNVHTQILHIATLSYTQM